MKKCFLLIVILNLSVYAQKDYSFVYQSDTLIKRGVKLHDEARYEDALKVYELIKKNDPNFYKAQSEIALTKFKMNKIDELHLFFSNLYTTNQMVENPDLFIKYGSFLDEQNQLDKAEEVFASGEKYLGNYANFLYNFGVHYVKAKKIQKAVDYFKKTILINPNYVSAHFMLGLLAFENGNISEGSLCCITYLFLAPNGRFASDAIKILNKKLGENYIDIGSVVFSSSGDNFSELTDILRNQFALNKNYKLKSEIDDVITRQVQAVLEYSKTHKIENGFFENYYIPWMQEVVKANFVEQASYYIFSGFDKQLAKQLGAHKKDIEKFSNEFIPIFWYKITTHKMQFYDKIEEVTIVYNNYKPILIGKIVNNKKEGKFIYLNEFGNKIGDLNYKNNLLNGEQKYYTSKGLLIEEKYFKDDLLEGERKYYFENGNLNFIENYKNGKIDGIATSFHVKGGKQCEMNFVNEEKEGTFTCYYPNGKLKSIVNYSKGKLNGIYKSYNEVGDLIAEGAYKNDNLEGRVVSYIDGKGLKNESYYKEGKLDQKSTSYYNNGTVSAISFYENGMLTKVIEYHVNGLKSDESYYEDDEMISSSMYDQLGNKFFEQKFKNGILVSGLQYSANAEKPIEINLTKKVFEIFYLDGTKYVTGEFKKGKKVGEWTYYNSNGTIKLIETFKDGKLEGMQYNYDKNGNLLYINSFKDGVAQGLYETYNSSKLVKEIYQCNDEKSGPSITYHPNNTISKEEFYLNNEIVNYSLDYDITSLLKSKTTYINDEFITYKVYDAKGNIESDFDFSNKSGKYSYTYNGGLLSNNFELVNGKYNGNTIIKDKNNTIELNSNYINGVLHGTVKRFSPNGKIYLDHTYYCGEINGNSKIYDLAGNLRLEYTSKFGESDGLTIRYNVDKSKLYENTEILGLLNGDYKWYNKKGQLILIIHYVNDIPVYYIKLDKSNILTIKVPIVKQNAEIVSQYSNGIPAITLKLVHGTFDGTILIKGQEGKVEYSAQYKNSELDGERIEYYTNGKVYKKESFENGDYNGLAEYFAEDGKKIISAEYRYDELNGLFQVFENGVLKVSKKYIGDDLVEIIK